MARFLLLLLLLSSSVALAEPCIDWPALKAVTGPRLAATGLKFTLNLRFQCELGSAFVPLWTEGTYAGPGTALAPGKFILSFPLPSGDFLYQALFSVPENQAPGIYQFRGCVRVKKESTGESKCIDLPALNMEIVGVRRG